jgi:hypothetical protein
LRREKFGNESPATREVVDLLAKIALQSGQPQGAAASLQQ